MDRKQAFSTKKISFSAYYKPIAALFFIGTVFIFFPTLQTTQAQEVTEATPPDISSTLHSSIAPPPSKESRAQQLDTYTFLTTRKLKNTPRWDLAYRDSNLKTPQLMETFSCASQKMLTQENAPAVFALFNYISHTVKTYVDVDKDRWKRIRPFVVFPEKPFCTEDKRESLGKTYSYPSGHTSLGWSFALVLTQLMPHRANAILERGRQYGESRIICGAHWRSDVEAGFIEASGIISQLQTFPEFQQKLAAARNELAKNSTTISADHLKQCHNEDTLLAPSPLDE